MTEKVLDSASTWDQCFLNDLLVGAGSEGVISDSNPGWSDDGAAHRMNCDTPPLKGNCPDTLVSRQIPLKTQHDYKTWYLARYRVNTGWRYYG
jgi:hypothetical protein